MAYAGHALMPLPTTLIKAARVLRALNRRVVLDLEIRQWIEECERRGLLDDPPETLRQEGIVG